MLRYEGVFKLIKKVSKMSDDEVKKGLGDNKNVE